MTTRLRITTTGGSTHEKDYDDDRAKEIMTQLAGQFRGDTAENIKGCYVTENFIVPTKEIAGVTSTKV